jgi:hypothetical protein
MKKDYLSFFPPISIGNSDIASLVLRTLTPAGEQVAEIVHFDTDGSYKAWECFGDDLEIPEYFEKVLSGRHWLMIYDDESLVYKRHPDELTAVDVYRLADRECVIHWHRAENSNDK